ncbi:cytochrome P450 [Penicillium sp. IBT 18751x]|nr:cytochrome P450 [Penicillium sp. IBT 18751x]
MEIKIDPFGCTLIAAVVYVLHLLLKAFTSPIRRVPGPLYTNSTRLPLKFATISGKQMYFVHQLHQRFGPVVRISPTEVSVSSLTGFKEIHRVGSGFLKSEWYEKFTPGREGIFMMRDAKKHAQRRKLFARSFSKSHLRTTSRKGPVQGELDRNGVCDVMKWATFLATDVSGHLMFGDSFDMLRVGKKTEYIQVLESATMGSGIGAELPFLRTIGSFLPLQSLRAILRADDYLMKYSLRAVSNGRKTSDSGGNIFSGLFYEAEKSSLTEKDVAIEAGNMIVAGSDTTAVTLTYLIWAILSRPKLHADLENELAGTALGGDFDDAALEALILLNAIIIETLRLYGAAPGALPRLVPEGGATFDEYFIPEGFTVITQSFTYSPRPQPISQPRNF